MKNYRVEFANIVEHSIDLTEEEVGTYENYVVVATFREAKQRMFFTLKQGIEEYKSAIQEYKNLRLRDL